ncbi:MAG TPA: antitoxin Xre/MbcA/ParS toxin-binding domain-containing protein [Rhodopila sp.]
MWTMSSEALAAEVLGIEVPQGRQLSLIWIMHAVTNGLPISSLDRVFRQVAPDDKAFVYRVVRRPTLARRREAFRTKSRPEQAVLSPDEGSKVARLAKGWAMGREVWGTDDAARAFLFRPHPLLEGQLPIDVVLATEFGPPIVERIVGRLQYGAAA